MNVLYLEQEDYGQAKEQLDNSLRLYRSLKNERDAARVLLNLAVVQQRQLNYEGALKLFRDCDVRGCQSGDRIDLTGGPLGYESRVLILVNLNKLLRLQSWRFFSVFICFYVKLSIPDTVI